MSESWIYVLLLCSNANDAIQVPPMSKDARVVVQSYGSWTSFCHSYGLKPSETEQNEEARQIAESLAKEAIGEPRPSSR